MPPETPAADRPDASAAPTVRSLLERTVTVLAAAGVPDPEVDAELLVGHVLGVSRGRVQALTVMGSSVEVQEAERVRELTERRAAREPLQHITGRAAFRSLELAVGPGVFVPRPETEQVAQFAIDALRSVPSAEPIAVDLGTGSGAIALALATEVPHARVFAVENSPEAFIWTRRNVDETGATNIRPVFIDLADALPELDGTVDVVISNPPYVPDAAIPRDPEVRLFDPAAALYGGEDGLDVVRVISRVAQRLLHPGGTLVLEHGELQGAAIRALLTADGWRAAATHRDLTTRDRATIALR
ncbi:peptide chain release factor N(5)-glutamine methyltransferase [Leifsonia aquatica]|uniref:Release factor glutamine methyltransferase n=2 Tax=Leifsonia aquatica TaxID=144185 RepID=U2R8W7_LEIAQ|nr:peptide chain release factor N(5)-glutamine methyltransferase [Leifsonia aquatica]ERK71705.1 protein-(glutamine-N5) methyltransferase [Leifsonia aquatica ATCC 14665]MBB2965808.1 release factor glutamine methyltransferase [Leifsonia aquatica]